MNYAALVVAISDYTENTFQTVDVNLFITQAEQRIYNSVQFPSLRKNVTGFTTASNKYLSCPSDYLSSYSDSDPGISVAKRPQSPKRSQIHRNASAISRLARSTRTCGCLPFHQRMRLATVACRGCNAGGWSYLEPVTLTMR